jgi:hypothetical protein
MKRNAADGLFAEPSTLAVELVAKDPFAYLFRPETEFFSVHGQYGNCQSRVPVDGKRKR